MTRTGQGLVGAAWVVAALVGCTSSSPPPPVTRPERVQVVEPPVRANPPSTSAISISPKAQIFTTTSPPGHVWFDLTNAGEDGVVEIVGLEYLGDDGEVPLELSAIRLDEVAIGGRVIVLDAGTHVLDLSCDRTTVPSGQQGYRYRLRAKIHGDEVEVETTVVRAYRHPIRRGE